MLTTSYTLPSDTHSTGDAGHTTDHNNLADVLTGMGAILNVRNTAYAGGAKGDGSTDDTAAIQAALNAATAGQIVYLPKATYLFSSVLTIPDGVGMAGDSPSYGVPLGNYGAGGLALQGTILKGSGTFANPSGAGGLLFMRRASGQGGGQRIRNISVDGSGLPLGNNLNGILIQDNTACVTLEGVNVYGSGTKAIGGDGLHCVSTGGSPPDLLNITWCHFSGCAGYGVSMSGVADTYISFTEATGNGTGAWNIINGNNARFTGCKAEGTTGTGGPGWLFTANSGFTGVVHLSNCTSQGNDGSGFKFTGTGTGTYQLVACSSDDDGHNGGVGGGGFAGLECTNFSGFVLTSGFNVRLGSIPSPQYGVSATSHNVLVMDAGVIAGSTASFFEGGGNATIIFGAGVVQGTKAPGGMYGGGTDGAVTFDGTTTYAGFSSTTGSAPNLVYTLTRDVQATSIVISGGITVKTANFRVFCQGSCTNNGTISNIGNNAAGSAQGASGGAGSLAGGRAGGNGGTGVSGAGGAGTNANFGSSGGGGGTGTSGAAGAAGTATVGNTSAQNNLLQTPWPVILGGAFFNNANLALGWGAGGGGGGSDASSNAGGGGGGGGGIVAVMAGAFSNSATGTVTAAGGNGANGTAGNAGGGGGGAGGLIAVYTRTPWTQSGTLNVSGGTKGTHVGTGADGVNGGAGLSLNVVVA